MPQLLSSLQLSPRKRGQHGCKCQSQTLLQPEAAAAQPLAESPTSPRPLEPETSKNDCEASSRLRFRAEIFNRELRIPVALRWWQQQNWPPQGLGQSHTGGTEPRTRLNPTLGATLGRHSMARRLIINSQPRAPRRGAARPLPPPGRAPRGRRLPGLGSGGCRSGPLPARGGAAGPALAAVPSHRTA